MNTSPDHPDFTALALGEHIHGTPAQAVLEALRTSVAARVEAEQIQATARQLAFALKGQPPLRLDTERRNCVLNADPEAVRALFEEEDQAASEEEFVAPVRRGRHSWVFPTLAAAGVAAAVVFALRLLPGYTPPSQRFGTPVADTDVAPNGKIMVTPERVRPGSRVPDPGHTPVSVVVKQEPAPEPPPDGSAPVPPEPPTPPAVVKDAPPQLPVLPPPPVDPSQFASPLAPSGASSSQTDPIKREPVRGKRRQ